MREIFEIVKGMYGNYNGTGMHMALFFAALFYLAVRKQKEEREKRFLFTAYTVFFFFICFFPVTAKIIIKFCIGQTVYWRMFWLLPVSVTIAYAGVLLLWELGEKKKKALLFFAMLLAVAMTGTNVYNSSIFQPKQNNYKLPQNTVDVCEIIERDAQENGISNKKLIADNELLSTIRQYDADILMPYGYRAVKGYTPKPDSAAQIFRIMSGESKNWEALSYYAEKEACNYLAVPIDEASEQALTDCGYEIIGSNAAYQVFRRDNSRAAYDKAWLVTQYGGANGSQLMFYTIEDKQGHLIVVDGGWESDGEYVKGVLKSLGNHVDAWILTHPHSDHAGAFTQIYPEPGKLKIDAVYAVDMAPVELCMENAPWDETAVYEKFLALDIPQLTYVHAGDKINMKGLSMEVLNAYDDYVDEISDDLLNDGSMMFKLTAESQSMLFCADVGKSMSDYLLETWGDALKADYVQMGHHGNGGLKNGFYLSLGAKGAFFDAPSWLMHDTSGNYTTVQNAILMQKNGSSIYSFETTPNQIVLK